jgi:ribosomal protein S19E (S16A)
MFWKVKAEKFFSRQNSSAECFQKFSEEQWNKGVKTLKHREKSQIFFKISREFL